MTAKIWPEGRGLGTSLPAGALSAWMRRGMHIWYWWFSNSRIWRRSGDQVILAVTG